MTDLNLNGKQGTITLPTADVFSALNQLVTAAREYTQVREIERTKRSLIAAEEQIQVGRIKAAEEVLQQYFDRVFVERSSIKEELFSRLDLAMESGDPEMVSSVVDGIVGLAKSSPLAGIEDFGKFWAELGTSSRPIEL